VQIRFLFWNIDHRPLQNLVGDLADEHQADIVILAECSINPATMISELTSAGLKDFVYPYSQSRDIRIFSRLRDSPVIPVADDPNNHVTVRRIAIGLDRDILLVAVHLLSKLMEEKTQDFGVDQLLHIIEREEKHFEHSRTILVGDLNLNPFDESIVGFGGLHAMMTKEIAARKTRKVQGVHKPFFYNPMWRFFGERAVGPPGSYYYNNSGEAVSYYWNIFDQVMVRPDLIDALTDVRIVNSIKGNSLLNAEGLPEGGIGSDHLPLSFTIALT
jgi:exonuclease III